MKYWAALMFLLFITAGFFILYPDAEIPGVAQASRVQHPFFNAKRVDVPFGTEKSAFAKSLVATGRYDDAVSVFSGVFADSQSTDSRASTVLMAAEALMLKDDAVARRQAEDLYEFYLLEYPLMPNRDTAHYQLGMMAAERHDAAQALVHFTAILKNSPTSEFSLNAAFQAQNLASMLQKQNESLKGRLLRIVGPFLPRNSTALVTLLTYLSGGLMFLAFNWKKYREELFEKKSAAAWAAVVLSLGLIVINYVREWQNAAFLFDAIRSMRPPRQ